MKQDSLLITLIRAALLFGFTGACADVSFIASKNPDLASDILASLRLIISASILNSIVLIVCMLPVFLVLQLFLKSRKLSFQTASAVIYFIASLPVGLLIIRTLALSIAGQNLLVPQIKAFYYALKYLWILIPVSWVTAGYLSRFFTEQDSEYKYSKLSAITFGYLTFLLLVPYASVKMSTQSALSDLESSILLIFILIASYIAYILIYKIFSRLISGRGVKSVSLLVIILIVLPFTSVIIQGESRIGTKPSGKQLSGKKSNVILVSLDTVRYDDIGAFGSTITKTPNIDAIAEKGICFDNAIAPMPITGPSHTSMLTGLQPDDNYGHNVRSNGIPLNPKVPTLPTILDNAGYETSAIIGASPLSKAASGLHRGFHYYHDSFEQGIRAKLFKDYMWSLTISRIIRRFYLEAGIDIFWVSKKANVVTDQAISWLEKWNKKSVEKQKPFFLFVHYYDAHDPYDPPAPYDQMYPVWEPEDGLNSKYNDRHLYRGEISYVDSEFGRLVDWLYKNIPMDNTLLIITGDHGESFEHKYRGHVQRLYESLIHVPLIIVPNENPDLAGTREDALVNVSDIALTVLNYLEIEPPDSIQSSFEAIPGAIPDGDHDLLKIAESENPNPGWAFVPSQSDAAAAGTGSKYGQFFSFRFPHAKLIYGPTCEPYIPKFQFFNLADDPQEENDIFKSANIETGEYSFAVGMIEEWASRHGSVELTEMDEHTRAQLEALGYLNK